MHAQPEIAHGLPCLRLTQQGASALVALHGAQVLSWRPDDGRERLFVSTRAVFDGKAAIRGGMPVIFPQFGERGALQKHGFARNQSWQFTGVHAAAAVFELQHASGDALWPYPCVVRLHIALTAAQLCVTLEIENTGDVAFTFTAALHTYLGVDDIAQVAIEGLQGCDFEDSANGGTLHRQGEFEVRCSGETDRIYSDVVAPLTLLDGAHPLYIEQEGFADAVVWSPGEQLCARIGDLAPEDWRQFVCVEAGQVLQPVLLQAGEHWRGKQCLG